MLLTAFRMSCATLAAIGMFGLSGCSEDVSPPDPGATIALPSLETTALPPAAIAAARSWYVSAGVDLRDMERLSVDDRARRLTQAVYAHCEQGNQTVSDLNDLFEDCVAACGGYSYVLRGLLEATGAQTRYVNLYNIPNQGNHTAVEVNLGDRWAFYDPTFGAYFTRDGQPDGPALVLNEIVAGFSSQELEGLVNQAVDRTAQFDSEPLTALFSGTFDHTYMTLENYQLAEARSRLDARELVVLDIPLTIESGSVSIGDFNAESVGDAQAAWLAQTNAILLDDDLANDISYVSHELSNVRAERITTVTVSNVQPGQRYEISLVLFGREGQEIQISAMGRSAFYGGRNLVRMSASRSVETARFVAVEDTAQFAIRNFNQTGIVRMLAIEVVQVPNQDG